MNDFWEIAPVIVVFYSCVVIINAALAYKIKRALIEKGMVGENIKYLSHQDESYFSSLKWGLVAVGAGAALLITRVMMRETSDEAMLGSMLLFGGIGLVIHYLIVSGIIRRNKEHSTLS